MTALLNEKEIIALRLMKNGLLKPFNSAEDCVRNLCGIQSQTQQFAEVSIFNRCNSSLKMNDLAECYEKNIILNSWGHRRTLHMYTADDWHKICDVYSYYCPSVIRYYDRLSPAEFEKILTCIDEESQKSIFITKLHIKQIIEEMLGAPHANDRILIHILIVMSSLRGIIFGKPAKPSIQHFISFEKIRVKPWEENEENQQTSLQNIMMRYFKCYSPATIHDFCHWSGISQSIAKKSLEKIRPQLIPFDYQESQLYF
jgi:hypothetical protein